MIYASKIELYFYMCFLILFIYFVLEQLLLIYIVLKVALKICLKHTAVASS